MKTLADVLQSRMRSIAKFENTDNLSLGIITTQSGLKLDDFKDIIPSGDYLICRSAQNITSGSRVLVGWVSGDPVVIDTIIT